MPRRVPCVILLCLMVLLGGTGGGVRAIRATETPPLEGAFARYWAANGGLTRFGLPLGPAIRDPRSDDLIVQYFERARFEAHPENAPPYDVLLGQFGREILAQTDRLSGSFGVLYTTSEQLRGRLGAPIGPATRGQGAVLEFERGRLIYRRNPGSPFGGTIYGLRGDAQAGEAFPYQRLVFGASDLWEPSQPVGGGPGPGAGLYEPSRGFGKFWNLYGGRDRLGYATAPDETAYPLTAQSFVLGVMLSTPDGREVYVLWAEQPPRASDGTATRYERIALPSR